MSDKYPNSPNHQSEEVKSETNNTYVVRDLLEEDPEDAVIYANQVNELETTTHFDQNYRRNEAAEEINARLADEIVSPEVFKIDKEDVDVIYANQVCESETIAGTYCGTKSHSKQPYLDNDSSVGVPADNGKEDNSTTVIYANQFSEIESIPETFVETPNLPPDIAEENQVPAVQNSHMEPDNTSPISPELNQENRSFLETSFDGNTFTSSHVPNKIPPEVQEDVALGETDVDTLSDIDEIDIDILPDESYQKSKSVTDLDEALASFGALDYLSNDASDKDNMSGVLSKSVPDILDSCREKTLKETVAISSNEKLQKKTLSLSTPEITSKSKPGSKKITKIKIVHVKFLEMQEGSGSENVEEDSFIYEGEVPISGKMKRRSRNLSPEFTSPVASPPADSSREISQERWISEKTNLKQLEFEFGDLFQNTPSPPPLEPVDLSNTNGSNQTDTDISKNISKFQDTSVVYSVPENSYETVSQVSSSKSTSDSSLLDSSKQRSSLTELNNQNFSSTNSSRAEVQNERIVSTQSSSSTEMYYKSSTTASSSTRIISETGSHINEPTEHIISALPVVTQSASSAQVRHQTTSINRISRDTNSKVEYQHTSDSPSLTLNSFDSPSKNNNSRPKIEYQSMQGSPLLTSNSPKSAKKTDSRSMFEYQRIPDSPSLTSNSSGSPLKRDPSIQYQNTQNSSSLIRNSPETTPKQTDSRSIFEYQRIPDSPSLTSNSSGSPLKRDPRVEYQNTQNSSPLIRNSPETISKKTDSRSYRYTPGSTHSYSKVPKPVPEEGKYVVKYAVIATQSTTTQHNTRNINTQARYSESPNSSSPASSPRHGVKLTEKFRISEDEKPPGNQTDGPKPKKSNHRVSGSKATSRQSGRMVTVKGGIINDYECSSDADSEMSYNIPSPRVKAKRFHRPQVHRDTLDSASSSEPDSPRRGQTKDDRRSMSELFGVTDEQSQNSNGAIRESRQSELRSSSREQKIFSRFGNLEQNEETMRNDTETNQPNVYRAKITTFDQKPTEGRNYVREPLVSNQARSTSFDQKPSEGRNYHARYTNALERNLSPTSFLQEGNLMSDDQMSPRTMEFNPFEELEGGDSSQPYERCHSPSSVFSDTSSVFSFNCDFDPMPAPSGKFEPEVYTCENPMCRKQDILFGPEKTSFKSCPACFTYYCSSECRKLHWPAHKQNCYFGRVNTYVRSIIRLCQHREDLSMYLSQLARDGYKKKGRGVVMAIFNSPDLAREFITKGHDAFSGRKPTYSSLADLTREGVVSKHRVALMQAVRDYEPNEEFVYNIAVVATNNVPIAPAPRYKLNTVLHCIKMPLNEMIVARQPKDYEKVETRLFALPKCSRHEFVNEMEARRHYCRNLSKNLRQYNIKLKEDYPECYRRLCMYVEHNISFEPMTVYGQRSGLSYRCVIAPEQSYPLNAEYC